MSSGATSSGESSCRKHPIFRGIRLRKGKWVSEMREPGKTTRIWLGTYRWPEMAAAAYDVAALALKGRRKAVLNFPGHVGSFPAPFSSSPQDIRLAAAAAAEMMRPEEDEQRETETERNQGVGNAEMASQGCDYIDEDELFYMPNLLVEMAEGMLLSPPRMAPPPPHHWPENFEVDSLWN